MPKLGSHVTESVAIDVDADAVTVAAECLPAATRFFVSISWLFMRERIFCIHPLTAPTHCKKILSFSDASVLFVAL